MTLFSVLLFVSLHMLLAIKLMGIYPLTAPVHQMQQYYRIGVLDNCADKWSSLLDCLNLKTKRSSEVEVGC